MAVALEIVEQSRERVVDHLGELENERRNFAAVEGTGDCHRVGEDEPDRGTGNHGGQRADEHCDTRHAVEATLEIVVLRRLFEIHTHEGKTETKPAASLACQRRKPSRSGPCLDDPQHERSKFLG